MENNLNNAIELGKIALNSLDELKDSLENSKSWGMADILLGGALVTMLKRKRIKASEEVANKAKMSVENFKNAISSIEGIDFKFNEITSSTMAVDYLGGIFGNIHVHGKIKENIIEVNRLYDVINNCVNELINKVNNF